MRNKNSAIMIGRVRSKSNSWAFSNSSARSGGGEEREAAAMAAREVTAVEERERSLVGFGSFGSFGIWGRGILGSLGRDEELIKVLEEAIIMLAMADFGL